MKQFKWLLVLAAGLFVAVFASTALADDTNQVTLTGLMICAKCNLHITSQCQNVLQVEQGGTNVNYFLVMNQLSKDFHYKYICGTDGEKTTVTGTVSVDNGTNIMTATEIKPAGDSK
jgi:hypothetical protein